MWYSDIETRIASHHYPKGGVAPLRRDLAVHDHIEAQRRNAERTGKLRCSATLLKLLQAVGSLAAIVPALCRPYRSEGQRAGR